MQQLEKQFTEELLKSYEAIAGKTEYNPTKFIQTIQKFGGVKTAKEIIRKSRTSDGFEKLQEKKLLAYTMEAIVIKAKYGELFSDDEVNSCYELLCEHSYFGI